MNKNQNPLPLLDDVVNAMINAAVDTIEPHEEGMKPSAVIATLTLAGVTAAYKFHVQARNMTRQNPKQSKVAFVKIAKLVCGMMKS